MRTPPSEDSRTRKLVDKFLSERAEDSSPRSRWPALAEAAKALGAIEDEHRLTLIERIELRRTLAEQLVELAEMTAKSHEPLPVKAPELWSDREGRKENPIAFIRRVYFPWLFRGLTRGDLRQLDPPLYQALAVWMHRHPDEAVPEFSSPIGGVLENAAFPRLSRGAIPKPHLARRK